jgi:AcrR family transcriptional regulator
MPRIVDVDVRRAELTDATARVIARSGIEAATMREIAAEAGWTTGALTHYFADKRELLLATFQSSLAARRSRRDELLDASTIERLRASLNGALPIDDDRRRHWLVTVAACSHASGSRPLADAQRDAYREFRDYLIILVEEVGLANGTDARHIAERLIALADGIAIQAMFDPESWPAERQQGALDAVLDSVLDGMPVR